MEVADGEGIQSEILRFAQNDSACIFLPFADFFTAPYALGYVMPPLTGLALRALRLCVKPACYCSSTIATSHGFSESD